MGSSATGTPAPPEALAASEVIAYVLADIAIILIAARIVGGLFVKMKQPRIVGEMIAGILIGPTILGGQLARGGITEIDQVPMDGSGLVNDIYPLQAFAFLNLIGLLTLVFFMFLVGLEVQQKLLKGREKQIVVVALAVVLVPVGLGFLIGGILDTPGKWMAEMTNSGGAVSSTTHALFIGAGLAVTAFPVMARILQEKRMLSTDLGAIGVGAAALVTPLMFLVVAAAVASAKGQGVPSTVGPKLLLALAFVAVLFVVVRPALRWVLDRRFKPDEPLDGEIFAMLLIGAVLSGFVADRIGIHSLNGGFLFGACVPQIAGLGRAVIERMLQFVVVFMIPIFLAVSGLQTDLTLLKPEHVTGILLFLTAMVVAKLVVGAVAGRAVGLNWQQAGVLGTLMNCRGLMILVVALIGKQAGVLTDPMQIAFVLGAIVTTLMTGPLVDLFLPGEESEEERQRSIRESSAALPAMSGGPRVVVAPGEPQQADGALRAARNFLATEGPKPQFLVVDLPGLAENGDYVGAGVEERDAEEGRSAIWLRPVAEALKTAGADAEHTGFQSPTPDADLAALASEWAATHAIVGLERDASALRAAGIEVTLL